MDTKYCISIEAVYGCAAPTVPHGWELTGEFRPPRRGETILLNTEGHTHSVSTDWHGFAPRLILRKTTTVEDVYGKPLSELTPPKGWRFTGAFRPPAAFEVYCTRIMEASEVGMPPKEARLILEKLPATPTIEDVYGTDSPAIPAGWKFKEFRQVKLSEKHTTILANKSLKALPADQLGFLHDGWRIVLKQDLSQFGATITPADFYGTPLPEVPYGYRVVKFAPPKEGQQYLGSRSFDLARVEKAFHNFGPMSLRLIVEPI